VHRIEFNDYERSISVSAWAERYAYDAETDTVHLLSLGGQASAVKAILAALVSNRYLSVEIHADDERLKLSAPHWKRLRTYTCRMPSGGCHGIFLSGGGEDDTSQLILDATPQRIFQVLYEGYAITALPAWAEWLAAKLQKEGHLQYLAGRNTHAAILDVTEEILDEIVSRGVADKELRFQGGRGNA